MRVLLCLQSEPTTSFSNTYCNGTRVLEYWYRNWRATCIHVRHKVGAQHWYSCRLDKQTHSWLGCVFAVLGSFRDVFCEVARILLSLSALEAPRLVASRALRHAASVICHHHRHRRRHDGLGCGDDKHDAATPAVDETFAQREELVRSTSY